MAEQENTPTEAEALAQTIEARLDDVVHEKLCACRQWPASCVTYGETRPWTHSDVGAVVAMTVDVLADERAKRPGREQIAQALAKADGDVLGGNVSPWYYLADAVLSSLAPEPEAREEMTWQWKDRDGDIWTPGEGGLLHAYETASFSREHVEKKWGPLVQVSRPAPGAREVTDAEVVAAAKAIVLDTLRATRSAAAFDEVAVEQMPGALREARAALEAAREVRNG